MEIDEELAQQIEEQVEEWSSNSNDVFSIELLRGDGMSAATFQPEFTYPIFGEQESIFGYQDLRIDLTFAAHNLTPHLDVKYAQKFKELGDVRPTDIHEALKDFLPAVAFSGGDVGDVLRDEKAAAFTPPGDKIHSYTRAGTKYEIWCASLSDPAAKQILENMQILLPMFVEGGTTLQLEQDWTTQRWKLFLLYHLKPDPKFLVGYSPYSLVGYGTSYRIFTFPDRQNPLQSDLDMFSPSNQSVLDFLPPPDAGLNNDLAPTSMPSNITSPLGLPSRERLSQFLILPPFQGAGHGQQLYNTMYTHLSSPPNIREFTVEDPNEAFDDLRDVCDLLYLRKHSPDFASLRINTSIPADQLKSETTIPTHLIVPLSTRDSIRHKAKIERRQFDRLVEMHTLSFIPTSHRSRSRITRKDKASNEYDRAYYFWLLYVKQRLYIFNRDQLAQLDRLERIEKMEGAVDSVLEGYVRCLERVEKQQQRDAEMGDTNGDGEAVAGATAKVRPSKRKVVDEEEDESEDEAVNAKKVTANGHKKARVD